MMRLRKTQKKDDAPSKVLPNNESKKTSGKAASTVPKNCTKTESANDGIVFPKSRRRPRSIVDASKETSDNVGSPSHLQSGSSSENMKNLRKLQKKTLPMGKGHLQSGSVLQIGKDPKDSTDDGKSSVQEPTSTTLLTIGLRSCGSDKVKKDALRSTKRHISPQKKKSHPSDSLTSPEKRLRSKFNIGLSSVDLTKDEIVPAMLSQVPVADENQKSPCLIDESSSPEIRNCNTKKSSMHQRSHINRAEPLLLLEEELKVPKASDNDDKLAEDIQTDASSTRLQSALNDTAMKTQSNKTSGSSPGESTVGPKSFYSELSFGKKVTSTPQVPSALNAWLTTAKNSSESEQKNTGSDGVPSASTDKQIKELSHKLVTNSNMEYQNMHTPVEARRITRLESTPQVSSANAEDLFGFEKLLQPSSSLFHHVSPIPKLPKELKRKKKRPIFPNDNGPNPWDRLLDLTRSHLTPKKKLNKKVKNRNPIKTNAESSSNPNIGPEIPEASEVDLFNVTPVECEKREFDEYGFDGEPFNRKTKRNKPIHKTAPLTNLNIEQILPWKDINEHELVIETV